MVNYEQLLPTFAFGPLQQPVQRASFSPMIFLTHGLQVAGSSHGWVSSSV